MKNRLFILSGIFVMTSIHLSAQTVSFMEAREAAQHFFGKTHKAVQTCADISIVGKDTFYYVFNADNAFVIVSAEQKAIPVLAYSYESTYTTNNVIPPVRMWLNFYQNQLLLLRQDNDMKQSEAVRNAWQELQHPQKQQKDIATENVPLLTSKWGQGTFYNYYCPKDDNGTENKRAVTGCVATAMGQLMYYFRFPETGLGNYTYTQPVYGEISADFGNTKYNYAAMSDKPSKINAAASLLIYHCGVAVDMQYGADASGMYNHKAAYALKNYFNFSPQTHYVFRDSNSLNWDSLITTHIDAKIPLYYAGWSVPDTNGHAFICDAYQKDTNNNYYYHFNFGWDGWQDGYFYTNTLSPSGLNFNLAQELILNAYPDTLLYPSHQQPLTGSALLTEVVGSFTDGSGYAENCPSYMDYTWVIRPDADSIKQIAFTMQYQLATDDTLFVSSKNTTDSYVLTNDTSSLSFNSQAKEITVRIKTANPVPSSGGFLANYTTLLPEFCSGTNIFSSKTGTLNDGSGTNRYNHLSDCSFVLRIEGVKSITLYFSEFETETDKDFLYIYNNRVTPVQLLATLSGTIEDSVLTFNTSGLFLKFITNEQNNYAGWTFTYATDVATGIAMDEWYVKENLITYPNPVVDYLYITTPNVLSNGAVQISDIYGKLLISKPFRDESIRIDSRGLAQGLYIVKIIDGQTLLKTVKISKE
jgi:hypothetical protein